MAGHHSGDRTGASHRRPATTDGDTASVSVPGRRPARRVDGDRLPADPTRAVLDVVQHSRKRAPALSAHR